MEEMGALMVDFLQEAGFDLGFKIWVLDWQGGKVFQS